MSAPAYAEHRSWRCWVAPVESGGWVLELSRNVSSMIPRVVVQFVWADGDGEFDCGALDDSGAHTKGPSGHVYSAGLSPNLAEVAEAVLGESGVEGCEPRLLHAGSDIDTSEVILRQALDVVRHIVSLVPGAVDSEGLRSFLEDRSAIWASW